MKLLCHISFIHFYSISSFSFLHIFIQRTRGDILENVLLSFYYQGDLRMESKSFKILYLFRPPRDASTDTNKMMKVSARVWRLWLAGGLQAEKSEHKEDVTKAAVSTVCSSTAWRHSTWKITLCYGGKRKSKGIGYWKKNRIQVCFVLLHKKL